MFDRKPTGGLSVFAVWPPWNNSISFACLLLAAIRQAGLPAVSAADPDYDRERYARRAAEFRGDAMRGQRLMRDTKRMTCLRCHKIGDEGIDTGPNLSN